jgi:hypothetical protein
MDTRTLQVGEVELTADLQLVPGMAGLVVFAHGSGSSRRSPRNTFVAEQGASGCGGLGGVQRRPTGLDRGQPGAGSGSYSAARWRRRSPGDPVQRSRCSQDDGEA